MKKSVKNLLFGVGIAAVGLAVYSLWKDTEEPIVVQDADIEPATTPSKEYVAHRRQQIKDAAKARKAAQEEAPVPAQEAAATVAEPSAPGETQEVSAPAQETAASADEAKEPPAAEEESEKPAE